MLYLKLCFWDKLCIWTTNKILKEITVLEYENAKRFLSSPAPLAPISIYIVWLSLIWDTDWLNTVTWLTNISVCSLPRAAEEEHWSIPQQFSRKQMANWACDTIASNMYVHRPWPRDDCLLRAQYNGYALHYGAQYNGYALHYAQLKGNPR